jgi:hypothetical protein
MKVTVRAKYFEKPYKGVIRIATLVGQEPVEFKISLFHESQGEIVVDKKFPSIEKAIIFAKDLGFMPHLWSLEQVG